MPMNSTMKARHLKSERELRFARQMKALCQPEERDGLYDVVSKHDGTVVARAIPFTGILQYGAAMVGYQLNPVS